MPYSSHYIAATGFLILLILGGFIFHRFVGRDPMDRLIVAAMPLLCGAAAFRILYALADRPFNDWDTVRLTPVFALAKGYPLYPTPDTGPVLSFCYGPVSALAYIPVVLSPTPTVAVIAAAMMTALIMLAPVFWIQLAGRSPGAARLLDACFGLLAFIGVAFVPRSLSYSLFSPAHDAVALSLGAIAAGFLSRRDTQEIKRANSLVLSALFAILSVWAKQNMGLIVLALPLYLWVVEGIRTCARYVCFLGVWGIAVSLMVLVSFDPEGLILNMFIIPMHHARIRPLSESVNYFQREFVVVAIPLLFALVLCFSNQFTRGSLVERNGRRRRGWLAFAILGIFQMPLGVVAYTKVGGDANSFSFSIYYLAIGAILLLSQVELCVPNGSEHDLVYKRLVAQAMLLSLASLLIVAPMLPAKADDIVAYPDPLKTAFEFEKKYPGRAYFPWNTLSVIMASGKLYHAEDGIVSLGMANMYLNAPQYQSHVPPNATLLAFPPNYPSQWTQTRVHQDLPRFRKKVTVEKLPGFSVYELVSD